MNGVQIIRMALVGTCVCSVFLIATQFEKATAKEDVMQVAAVQEFVPEEAAPVPKSEAAPVLDDTSLPRKEPTLEVHAAMNEQAREKIVEPPAAVQMPAPPLPAPEPVRTEPAPPVHEFLSLHNEVRTDLDLPSLTWSPDLAAKAQSWADTLADEHSCELIHSNEPYGENLFSLWSSDGSVRGTPEDAMDWWAGEVKYYDYNSNTCEAGEVCGHYTQIVWETTTEVGCAIATCSDQEEVTDLFVCKYSPQGNITGKRPY